MSPRIERLLFYAFAAACLLTALAVVWVLVAVDRLGRGISRYRKTTPR